MKIFEILSGTVRITKPCYLTSCWPKWSFRVGDLLQTGQTNEVSHIYNTTIKFLKKQKTSSRLDKYQCCISDSEDCSNTASWDQVMPFSYGRNKIFWNNFKQEIIIGLSMETHTTFRLSTKTRVDRQICLRSWSKTKRWSIQWWLISNIPILLKFLTYIR